MARSADSLSVFVVQRSFRRVIRGYDPDEVEHHLERVSQWFSETGARAAVREAEAQLSEREKALRDADEDLRRRSDAARGSAESVLEEARAEAATIMEKARADAAAARRDADAALVQAGRQSEALFEEAR